MGLTPRYDAVARFQGGPNAGHTLEFEGKKYVLRSIPSGIFQHGQINIIGNGVVLDPVLFKQEAEELEKSGVDLRSILKISKKVHLITPTHRLLDAANEKAKGGKKIGTTGKGIGPTYTDKISRNGLRLGDVFHNFKEKYSALRQRHLGMLASLGATPDNLEQLEETWMDAIRVPDQPASCRGQECALRRRSGNTPRYRLRLISIRDLFQHHQRRRMFRSRCRSQQDR